MIRVLTKLDLLKIKKNADVIKILLFGQFSDLLGPHGQVKRQVTNIYSERTSYWLSYPLYKTQKNVFVLEE